MERPRLGRGRSAFWGTSAFSRFPLETIEIKSRRNGKNKDGEGLALVVSAVRRENAAPSLGHPWLWCTKAGIRGQGTEMQPQTLRCTQGDTLTPRLRCGLRQAFGCSMRKPSRVGGLRYLAGGGVVKISRRAGSGFGLGFGAFFASLRPLSLDIIAPTRFQY